jgi:hypothetical protein
MWTTWIVHRLLHGIWVAIVLYHKKTWDRCSSEENIIASILARKKKGAAIYRQVNAVVTHLLLHSKVSSFITLDAWVTSH